MQQIYADPEPMTLYHITSAAEWESQRNATVFTADSLKTEGFIHASTAAQVQGTLQLFFENAKDLCIFSFDPALVPDIRFEWVKPAGQAFPHVFGPVPRTAITGNRLFSTQRKALEQFINPKTALHRILECAAVPSFSSFEEHLHPTVLRLLSTVPEVTVERISLANLLIRRSASRGKPVVVLSAHLDKINHFGEKTPLVIPAFEWREEIEGLLDDATGIGIVLSLFLEPALSEVDLVLSLSEMEEGTGLRTHPHLLRNGGEGLSHGMGARTLANRLLRENERLCGIVTIDTTPFFKGKPGTAVYSNHWELNRQTPSPELVAETAALCDFLSSMDADLQRLNNTNDYLEYGKVLIDNGLSIPSIALEPAIFPYHCATERVFKSDIEKIYQRAMETVLWLASRKG